MAGPPVLQGAPVSTVSSQPFGHMVRATKWMPILDICPEAKENVVSFFVATLGPLQAPQAAPGRRQLGLVASGHVSLQTLSLHMAISPPHSEGTVVPCPITHPTSQISLHGGR